MAREATGQVVTRKGKRGITYAARVRAYGERHYLSLGYSWDGYTRRRADTELQNILADIRRGIWKPPQPEPAPTPAQDPTFHEFASQWLDGLRHELAPRTIEDYELALTHHLLPFFKNHRLSQITAQETDRYKTAKVREREQGTVERPLSNRTINKTLTRLGQILDVAVRYELIPHNPVKSRVAKLKERPPARARMHGHQVQVLLQRAGRHRVLLATAIMAGGLRVSELINLRWRDVDLTGATLQVPVSKTEAGLRLVHLEAELVALLREHKLASRWSQPEDFVFPGRRRDRPRERNSVRTRVLHTSVKRANKALEASGQAPIPAGITFHALRRTYAALRAELGEHPAITAAQMGHTDPRMTLRVYTDVTGQRPRTNMAGLLGEGPWTPENGQHNNTATTAQGQRTAG